jgi:glucan phosphoethanolaminetransferase (alkaline phosphatase superfamily)
MSDELAIYFLWNTNSFSATIKLISTTGINVVDALAVFECLSIMFHIGCLFISLWSKILLIALTSKANSKPLYLNLQFKNVLCSNQSESR